MPRKTKEERYCMYCGKKGIYARNRCELCYKEYNRERVKKYYIPKPRTVTLKCSICNKDLTLTTVEYKNGKREHKECEKKQKLNSPFQKHDIDNIPIFNVNGYLAGYIPNHPRSWVNGSVYVHRLVMENVLGRYLEETELVHHKDEDRSNNVSLNLKITDKSTHTRDHCRKKEEIICPVCKKVFYPTGRSTRKYCSTSCKNTEHYDAKWPSNEELEKLVWEMSTVQLAKQLGVSSKAIEKRCKKHGIEKPPRGYWAKTKSKNKKYPDTHKGNILWPSKEDLKKLIWEKSIPKIARDFSVNTETVRYWCKKYNIETPPAGHWSRGKKVTWPSSTELQKLVQSKPLYEVADIIGVALKTLKRHCSERKIAY